MTDAGGPGPLLVTGADTMLLQVDHPDAEQCRSELARFAELERSPEHVHTYRLTDLGLWNAKAAGLTVEQAVGVLHRHSATGVPQAAVELITESMGRFGPLSLGSAGTEAGIDTHDETGAGVGLVLRAETPELLDEILEDPAVAEAVGRSIDPTTAEVEPENRGRLKQALTALRRPVDDRAALSPGTSLAFELRSESELRSYQRQAVDSWLPSGTGVIVLPCGAGKTITGLAAAAANGTNTLILVTGQASLAQWERELLRFTDIEPGMIGHYSADRKEIRPITIATYQVMSNRRDGRLRHLEVIDGGDWGLVIYDEVHLLPSAVFQMTAGIQARRRLGLTATLVREDGREADVFTLIGPKRFDVPWADLELQGWIAPATCTEIRVVPDDDERLAHARAADTRGKAAVAASVRGKEAVVERLLARHGDEPILIIGTHLAGLRSIAARFELDLITGETPQPERARLFDRLRRGLIPALVVSKVANFSLDLPEVSVAVQVSGSFGSRQEEAQRLGRIIRPKPDGRQAHFYSVVARDTVEQELSRNRQRFLTEQGYHYRIVDSTELDDTATAQP